MTVHYDRDPEHDEALSGLLRDAAGPTPAVDWDALRSRITAAAELPLAQSRRQVRRRLSPLMRALLPLAAAAGIAGAYVTMRPAADMTARDQAMVDQMVEASLPESVDQLINGEATQGALLEVVEGS